MPKCEYVNSADLLDTLKRHYPAAERELGAHGADLEILMDEETFRLFVSAFGVQRPEHDGMQYGFKGTPIRVAAVDGFMFVRRAEP